MEILIQDSQTKLYFTEDERWVKSVTEARVFLGPSDALRFCVEHHLKRVQLGFKYDKSTRLHYSNADGATSAIEPANPVGKEANQRA